VFELIEDNAAGFLVEIGSLAGGVTRSGQVVVGIASWPWRGGLPLTALNGLRCRWFGVADSRLGVVVIGGSGGGVESASFQAEQLATVGVSALAVGYHGFGGLPTLANIPLERFGDAVHWLREQASIPMVALLGSSRGSEAALLTAALVDREVAAVVALVPGNVVLSSWPPTGQPAWTLAGEPLPYVVNQFGPQASDPEAIIPVEEISGPLFLVGAGRDTVWPSVAMVEAIHERRLQHGHRRDVVLQYPEAGYSLGLLGPRDPPHPLGDASERDDAWRQLVGFLGSLS
jgi:dienelactone hydrolase